MSEVVLAASSARTCVTETVQAKGQSATSNLSQCGGDFEATRYATNLLVGTTGIVTVESQDDIDGVTIELSPVYQSSFHITEWICSASVVTAPAKNSWLPGSCR
ncbi:pilin [Halopseudomonas sp.]|uniref:pilin n=1 Tax=Halopseudomonas sp. TaxID=2901191 RepID=UPI00353030E8